jgi:hypothetical protein
VYRLLAFLNKSQAAFYSPFFLFLSLQHQKSIAEAGTGEGELLVFCGRGYEGQSCTCG